VVLFLIYIENSWEAAGNALTTWTNIILFKEIERIM
jgi:hypothetical protein